MKDIIKFLCIIILLVMGFVTLTACSGSMSADSVSSSLSANSTFLTKEQIIGTYKNDVPDVITISDNSFKYTHSNEDFFEFDINDTNWEIKRHSLKFDCYMVTVNGTMKKFESSKSPSPSLNNNIKNEATTLTWIVRMIYSNGKNTGLISEMLLPTDDAYVELVYKKY
ncbi:MAG: hypothetical protein LBC76_02000 [Treponema sp.]|jgi:peptidoglycan hydrolase CwlO-like protein|nr:hypothetical protein [Treponema sp.]